MISRGGVKEIGLKPQRNILLTGSSYYMRGHKYMTNRERALNILPELYRKVLELRFDKKFSIHETADYLNLEMIAVRNLQYRALKELNQVLSELQRDRAVNLSK